MNRRDVLQLAAGVAAPGLAWSQASAPGAASGAMSASGAKGLTPTEWMDQWIKRWESGARPVDGFLYLGRFADPFYFVTRPINWSPNAKQKEYASVTVPVGFVTDFASIPRAFWSLLRPDGNYAYAAVIHDYLYWTQPMSREKSDMIFKFAMQDFKIDAKQVGTIYSAVRLGGSGSWKDNAKRKGRGEKRVLKEPFPTDPTTRWEDYRQRAGVFKA